MSIELTYDRVELRVNDAVEATALVTNKMNVAAPMVLLDLLIPAGFSIDSESLESLVSMQKIAKFQLTPKNAIVYLRNIEPAAAIAPRYRLHETMPVKTVAPAARVYEYYDPAKSAVSAATLLSVGTR